MAVEAEEGTAELERFAARTLEWPLVREVLLRHAPGPLARRALAELAPRTDAGARAALARAAELAQRRAAGPLPLGAIEDPLPFLEAARSFGRALHGEELCGIGRFLRGARGALAFLRESAAALPVAAALADGAPDLAWLEERLDGALDDKGELRDDASPRLAGARREVAELLRSIEETVRRIASRRELKSALAEGQSGSVHRRGGRPVLAVRARMRGAVPGIVHDRSQSGETLFVEPSEVVEAGNRLAERKSDVAREEARLYLELSREVLDAEAPLRELAARVAELDLARLSAEWCSAEGAVVARQPGDPGAGTGLVLRGLRHPLLAESLRSGRITELVPLDLRLGGEFDMLIVTGPNTGGKTLALKSAGLAVLLTRLGLPVLAEAGTTVPLFDGVAADIGDEQEVAQSLSTFSSHLARIRDALARATERTLVLLDELGGGTDPDEGAALGEAILEELLARRVPTLVSTHLGKLKEFAFRHARAENACVEFDLVTLAPRYRLLVGTPGESRALYVARRLGLDPAVLARAEERVERRSEEVLELLEDVRRTRERAEVLRSEAEERLSVLERDERALVAERSAVDERGRRLEAEAQRGLEERLAAGRPLLARCRALLPQLPRGAAEDLGRRLDELEGVLTGAAMGERRRAFLDGVKKGHLVWVPRFRQRLPVVRVWRERGELSVRMGKAQVTLSFDEVTEYEGL